MTSSHKLKTCGLSEHKYSKLKYMEKDYQIAVEMYKQYQNDVAKVGVGLNIHQIKTLQLLEENFRIKQPIKLKWHQKLIGAFKNRRF